MSLQRPTSYGPRITIVTLALLGVLGFGLNVDALLGPVPEQAEELEEGEAQQSEGSKTGLSSGTDFDMETHVAEIMLGKATEKLLSKSTAGLPELADDWTPESLPRDAQADPYVEDEDEAEYYEDLDPLDSVMKVANDKERAALAKLFEKEPRKKEAASKNAAVKTNTEKTKVTASKRLALRPNAARITKKKAKDVSRAQELKPKAKNQKAPTKSGRSASAKTEEGPSGESPKEVEPPVEADEEKGPEIDPNASAKELIAQGRKLLLSGSAGSAEKAFRLALKKKGSSARARYGLAKALYQRNRGAEAIAELRKILNANKNHGSALLMMGSLLQEQGQAGQAKTYYQRYLDARPNGRRADEVRSILGRL